VSEAGIAGSGASGAGASTAGPSASAASVAVASSAAISTPASGTVAASAGSSSGVAVAPPVTTRKRWMLPLAIIAALLVAGIGGGGYYFTHRAPSAIDSVAVLPLANATSNSEMDYLADGSGKLVTVHQKPEYGHGLFLLGSLRLAPCFTRSVGVPGSQPTSQVTTAQSDSRNRIATNYLANKRRKVDIAHCPPRQGF
jgi:hypothetical protein